MFQNVEEQIQNSTMQDIIDGLNETIERLNHIEVKGHQNMSLFVVCIQALINLCSALEHHKEGEAIEHHKK